MKRKAGIWLVLAGLVMLFSAGGLFLYNKYEDERAGVEAQERLILLVDQIQKQKDEAESEEQSPSQGALPDELWIPELFDPEAATQEPTMETMEVDGNGYVGYISMPTIKIELPVMADWDYEKLLVSPCYYYGTVENENLVLMAHNYTRHFGKLSLLNPGDPVFFVDIKGEKTEYAVVHREILPPKCIPELTEGAFDLTLFTCTYSGANRVTVRCDRVGE